MRNIYVALLVFISISLQSNAQCSTYSSPYSEDFTTWPPVCWDLTGGTQTVSQYGGNAIEASFWGWTSGNTAYATSPTIDVSTLSNPVFTFDWSHSYSASYPNDGLEVFVSDDDGANWTSVWLKNGADFNSADGSGNTAPGSYVTTDYIDLSNFGSLVQVQMVFTSGYGPDAFVTNFSVLEAPSCLNVSSLEVTGITSTGASASWNANNSETVWEYQLLLAGEALGSSWNSTTDNPLSITGCYASTAYDLYVRAVCSSGDESEAVSVSFITACDTFTAPYNEDFTTWEPICWDLTGGSQTVSQYGGNALEASFWGWTSGNTGYATSPLIDTSNLTDPVFDFNWSHLYSTSYPNDQLEVFVSDDNGTTWTSVWLKSGAEFDSADGAGNTTPGSYVHSDYISLASYGNIVQVQFIFTSGYGPDAFVNDFNVYESPSCIPPSALSATNITDTGVDVSWTANNGETSWEYVIVPAGSPEPDAAGTTTTTNPLILSNLTPSTAYDIYIRAECSSGDFSSWTGPLSITTLNTPPPAPVGINCSSGDSTFAFVEEFSEQGGWTGTFNSGNGSWEVPNDSGSGGTGADAAYSGNSYMNYESSGNTTDTASAVSPAIDLSTAVDAAELSFYMHAYGADTGTLNVGISTDQAGPFTTVYSWIGEYQSSGADPWVPIGINLDAYLGQVIYIEFSHTGSGSGFEGDMSIDYLRVETCGSFCLAPSGLTASNILDYSADLSWTANGNETEWEYVLSAAGTGEPSGNGTTTSTTSFSTASLNPDTTYELYVRAVCGDGDYSIWAGPYNFTTTPQVSYTIDCNQGPLNFNYCYDSNDTTVWQFTSSNGFPVRISFNSGTIEAGYDDITIYDGPNNTFPVLFNNNSAGQSDFTGLVVDSTGDTMFIEVGSDGSVSCQSGSQDPWDFDVSCITCISQTVDYEVVGVCEPNQEFTVEVDITSMGDATLVNVFDDQGSPTQSTSSIGVLTFGPYPSETPVRIYTENAGDSNCATESNVLNFICPPPPNPCSVIYAGEDTETCEGVSTTLTANFHILGQNTNEYEITQLTNCDQPPNFGGEPTSVDVDDTWSDVIDLGFDFCFFGDTYSQIVIGSNGVISFDTSTATNYNGWNIDPEDTLPNNDNPSLSEANIFGAAHDIDPSVCGEVNYFIFGSSPSRMFVVNYTEVCHFSCNDLTSSTQIILYESSNTIDVNIFNKPVCDTWNDGNAVIGIQNPDDTIAYTPEGRNTGVWTATDEFWRFSPSIGTPSYTLEWFDGDTLVGTGDSVSVTPTESTEYTAAITYELCNGGTATLTDSVMVDIYENPEVVAAENDVFICEGLSVTLEVEVPNSELLDTMTYYWTYEGQDVQVGPDNTYTIPEGANQYGEYIATAIDERGCFGNTVITVTQGEYPDIIPVDDDIIKCANEEATIEIEILNSAQLSDQLTVTWYLNGVEVQSGSGTTFIHGVGEAEGTVTAVVTDEVSLCNTETDISVSYYENANCVDIPQGISPNGDGFNDCLVLDHLEDREDIIKAEVYNRYGVKVFELNDYTNQWCGEDQSDGSTGELLPVGTYFYVIHFASDREPIISWIYLNY